MAAPPSLSRTTCCFKAARARPSGAKLLKQADVHTLLREEWEKLCQE